MSVRTYILTVDVEQDDLEDLAADMEVPPAEALANLLQSELEWELVDAVVTARPAS